MARARLRIGERGDIGAAKHVNGSWKARCSYRDSRGARKQLTAVAKTKSAAITALKDKWHDISSRIITRHDNLENLTVDQLALISSTIFLKFAESKRLI